ncbi:MAG: DnaA regulatory inactivator Hda [Stenotrophobium sp.]
MKGQQLPLPVQLRESASFASFHAGPNDNVVTALRSLSGPVLIYGAAGSGRTHLLQAVARERRCPYLPLLDLHDAGTEALDGLEGTAALCLDDVQAVLAQRDWALALLRLLDTRRTLNKPTVLAADAAPERIDCILPDLRTRLSACAVFGLKPLSDTDRADLLHERAHARGLELPPETSRWLLNQLARDTGSLLDALEKLDRASLSAQRRLTLPFAQSVLAPGISRTG